MSLILLLIFYGMCGLTVMTFVFYGWGRLTRRLTALPRGTWPMTAALGLATVTFIGGLLNLLHLARPAAFGIIVVAGLLLASQALRRAGHPPQPPALENLKAARWTWWIFTVSIMAFVCATQLAPWFYNSGDDFNEYFGHAVRMVETGTLYGDPLNASGAETLGAQAFLQGFIVSFAPLRFMNGADAVFCLFLCMAMAGAVGIARPALARPALLATIGVFAIDPLYVNVSSLYSTAVVVSALTLLATDGREGGPQSTLTLRRVAAPALLLAAGVALKTTNVVFVLIQFTLSAGCSCLIARRWQEAAAGYGRMAAMACAFLSPWLLLYSPYYVIALTHPLRLQPTPAPGLWQPHLLALLLAPGNTFYGAPELAFTCVAVALLACTFSAVSRVRSVPHDGYPLMQLGAATASAAVTYLFWVLFGPHLQELTSTLRYSIPVLIGCAPIALPLWSLVSGNKGSSAYAAVAILLCLFLLPLRDRLETVVHRRSQLAYLHQWNDAPRMGGQQLTQRAFDPEMARVVRGIQSLVPPGEALLVWTAAPFLLDYRRNEIIDVNEAGFSQRWGHLAPVRYVLWQHDRYASERQEWHYGMRFGRRTARLAERSLEVLEGFKEVTDKGETLYDASGVKLVRTLSSDGFPLD